MSDIRSHALTRRRLAQLGLGAAAVTVLPARALAQSTPMVGSTPVAGSSALAGLGYPELKLTITDTGYEGVPTSTAAGRYLITATDQTKNHQGAAAFLSPTPAGLSAAAFIQLLSQFSASAATPAGATPMMGATPMASPGASEGNPPPPPLEVYKMYFAGGAGVPPQGVIDLRPGEYIVWGDDPTASQKPAILTVTGNFPLTLKDPQADVTATLVDFAISFAGSLTAGSHTLKVQHHGAQPHFLILFKGPASLTKLSKDQLIALVSEAPNATPTPGLPSQQDLQPVFYSPTQSLGTVTWHPLTLQTGAYLAACFFPTAGTGVPHAMNGMVDVVTVSG